jgi:DNA-binding NtrC family response regulator
MTRIATRIPKIVNSAITCIHINGESGTGKEVVAQMFRKAVGEDPFIAISCATIPETLIEATLFGSIKGAFTGATKDLKGIFEEANGGWIFLDEVGCLSRSAQAALLRAIENQEVIPVGENRAKKLNFRVISATNASLKDLTRKGEFRLDLYNRLAEVEIYLPPLRERRDELPHLIQCLVETLPGGPYSISAAARRLLESHPWAEGNVRQLRNCLRAMTEFHVDGCLTPQGIPRKILEEACAYARGKRTDEDKAVYTRSHSAHHLESGSSINPAQNDLRVRWAYSKDDEIDFDRMSLELFYQIAKTITHRNGRFSTRDLAGTLKMSRSTISRRINQAIEQKVGDFEALMVSFGIRSEIFD